MTTSSSFPTSAQPPPCAAHLQRTVSIDDRLRRIEHIVTGNGNPGLDEVVRELGKDAKDHGKTLIRLEGDIGILHKRMDQILKAVWIVATYFAITDWERLSNLLSHLLNFLSLIGA